MSMSKNINPSLILVQPRRTSPFITERLLMVHKESNKQNKRMYFCPRRLFLSKANSADPDEMPPYAAFHLGLHCLSKYLFIGIQNEKG